MADYEITWGINIEATDPVDAARQALGIQRDPFSVATVFEITEFNGERRWVIDVEDPDNPVILKSEGFGSAL